MAMRSMFQPMIWHGLPVSDSAFTQVRLQAQIASGQAIDRLKVDRIGHGNPCGPRTMQCLIG